jgi:hypothetical protein
MQLQLHQQTLMVILIQFVLNAPGETITLLFKNSKWYVIGGQWLYIKLILIGVNYEY